MLGGSWDALSDNRCDLVIGAAGAPPGPGFSLHSLGEVAFDFAVAADHPLRLDSRSALPTSAILDYPTVVVADSSQRLPARSTGLLDGRSRIIVPSIDHKIDVQCKGLGVGYLPHHRIAQDTADGLRGLKRLNPPSSVNIGSLVSRIYR